MTIKQIERRIDMTREGIERIEQKIRNLEQRIHYRKRRLRELGRKHAEAMNYKLFL